MDFMDWLGMTFIFIASFWGPMAVALTGLAWIILYYLRYRDLE